VIFDLPAQLKLPIKYFWRARLISVSGATLKLLRNHLGFLELFEKISRPCTNAGLTAREGLPIIQQHGSGVY
jgi:hypothetical protein